MYKQFRDRRPESYLDPSKKFFLTPIVFPHGVDHCEGRAWYKEANMGRNQIGKYIPDVAKQLGWKGKITNHSIRKTLCNGLLNKDVNPNLIMQVSGHKNPASINNYASANMKTQKELYKKILNVEKSTTEQEVTPVVQKTTVPSTFTAIKPTPVHESGQKVNKLSLKSTQIKKSMPFSSTANSTCVSNTVKEAQPVQMPDLSSLQGFLTGAIFHGPVSFNIGYGK